MKKIYSILALAVLSLSANAQRNLKLQIDIVKPALDTNIVTGSTTYPHYVISNISTNAADSVAAGDTIWIKTPANTTTSLSGIIPGSSIKIGQSFIINNTTITGGYSVPFANIETLVNSATTYVSKPFTNNTQYWWYAVLDTVIAKTGNPGITTVNYDFDTQRIWINKASGVVEFANNKIEGLKTYPNPATSQLSFEYNFAENKNALVTISDVAGRVVYSKNYSNNYGNQKFDLDINVLSNGAYILQVVIDDKTLMSKFNVQK